MMAHDHSPESISKRLAKPQSQSYLRDWIYGGIDGAVTTFAVVSSIIGANLSIYLIIILGLANVFADGLSMAASNFLGTKSEHDELEHYKLIEEKHIKSYPEGEKQEIRQLLMNKGVIESQLESLVEIICNNESLWISTMLQGEYGVSENIRSPWKAALSTFIAFLICGLIPLTPFILGVANGYIWSCLFTGLVFFLVGSIKSKWSLQKWWLSGIMTLFIGAIAAITAYIIGFLLRHYFNLNM